MRSHLIKMALIEKGQGNEDGEAIATSYKGLQLAYIAGKKASPIPGGKFPSCIHFEMVKLLPRNFFLIFFYLKIHRISMHFSPNKATNLEFKHFDSSVLI